MRVSGQQEVNTLVKRLRKTFPLENRRRSGAKLDGQGLIAESEIKKEKLNDAEAAEDEDAIDNGEASDSDEMSGKQLRHKLRRLRQNMLPEINLDE